MQLSSYPSIHQHRKRDVKIHASVNRMNQNLSFKSILYQILAQIYGIRWTDGGVHECPGATETSGLSGRNSALGPVLHCDVGWKQVPNIFT